MRNLSCPSSLKSLEIRKEGVEFFQKFPERLAFYQSLPFEKKEIYLQLILLGNIHFLLHDDKKVELILSDLYPTYTFFKNSYGLIGYQKEVESLLTEEFPNEQLTYHGYAGIDISEETLEVKEAIALALEHLPCMAEMYAIGGAADRLNLHDPNTKKELPAACLSLNDKTLLEYLIGDLRAKEHLYYRLFGKKYITPVVLMTSQEKQNHDEIIKLFEANNWYGRPKDSFYFFDQPLVPVVDRSGQWQTLEDGRPFLKPGGHGVIWKLAKEEGVLDKLKKRGITSVLIRQINNPIAGVDYGLLAFVGMGIKNSKKFGFASCERVIQSAEGMNVLIEKPGGMRPHFVLTNVEYCDFKKYGIADEPKEKGSPYSKFSSNTNLLFARLDAIAEAVEKVPLPGKILNFKQLPIPGSSIKKELARLETMMQNIADSFEEETPHIQNTYLTFNKRKKTISTVKKQYQNDKLYLETPEACFYDMMLNAYDLMHKYLHFKLVRPISIEEFYKKPPFIFTYSPTLGPLYEVIAQKISKGKLTEGAELRLDISELYMENLELEGSLIISSTNEVGECKNGLLQMGEKQAVCFLKNVKVINQGFDPKAPHVYWKNQVARKGSCEIILKGFSELYAENVVISGDMKIVVEDGERVVLSMDNNKLILERTKLTVPLWNWVYKKGSSHTIALKRKALIE